MRFITLSGIVALFVVLGVSSVAQAEQYLLVEEPLAKIYKELDPKSPLIKQVKKGTYLELVYDGETWHKVKIDGQIGWIEKRAGKIVDKQGGLPIVSIFLFILVAVITIVAVLMYIQRNKTSPVEVDEV